MTNELLVEKIQAGINITENMKLLYENNLPLIKQFIKPYVAYESADDLLRKPFSDYWKRQNAMKLLKTCFL